jgi:transposase
VAVTFPQEKSLSRLSSVAIAQTTIGSLVAAMTPEELFTAALGLGQQWRVVECRFEGEPKRLELRLEHVRGQHFECPQCGTLCGVHDTIERRWRHLNFFQYRCELVAKVPRTWCRKDGVHQVQAPWAREGSGFTLMMEALMMLLSAQMPVDAMADLLDEHDTRLWRVLMHYVEQAHAKERLERRPADCCG